MVDPQLERTSKENRAHGLWDIRLWMFILLHWECNKINTAFSACSLLSHTLCDQAGR